MVLKESNRIRTGKRGESGDLKSPLKSPLKPRKSLTGVLSPNDDARERKTTRAKQSELKARRRSLNVSAEASAERDSAAQAPKPRQKASVLELQELYQNCIKLSSENKISSKNTWDLNLIEHLSELVRPENKVAHDHDSDLNFQKASCTLDAGVKIYSSRVDSIHTDAFKVLGGLHRTSNEQEDGQAGDLGADGGSGERKVRRARKQVDVDPSATLEQNQEALNVKKFDLSFAVDPLFHQTSMKFDEGGAKGLLLNHLNVTQGCELVFDSCDNRYNRYVRPKDQEQEEVDVEIKEFGSIAEHIESIQRCDALRLTVSSKRLEGALGQRTPVDEEALAAQVHRWIAADASESLDESFNDDDGAENIDDDPCASDSLGPWMDSSMAEMDMESDGEEVNDSDAGVFRPSAMMGEDGSAEGLAPSDDASTDWLSQIGLSSQFNKASWAGMSHWRYRGAPPKPSAAGENEAKEGAEDQKKKKKKSQMIDFENLPPLPKDPFRPAKSEKDISLKTDPQNSQIEFFPEDVHYEVSNLGKLFFKPSTNLKQLHSRRQPGHHDVDAEDYDDEFGATSLGFDDDAEDGGADDVFGSSGFGEEAAMEAPRMVEQIDINYDRTSKQVDVKKLKEALWVSLDKDSDSEKLVDGNHDFQGLLDTMGDSLEAAGKKEDVSLHLCFICLLHLANENTLKIEDCPTMDRLTIQQD